MTDADGFLRKLTDTDPEILAWIRELLVIRDRQPAYEAAVNALERLVAFDEDPGNLDALQEARAVLSRLRGEVPA